MEVSDDCYYMFPLGQNAKRDFGILTALIELLGIKVGVECMKGRWKIVKVKERSHPRKE